MARAWVWAGEGSGQCSRLDRCKIVEGGCREENIPGTEDSVESRVGALGEWLSLGRQEGARVTAGEGAGRQGCVRIRGPESAWGAQEVGDREITVKQEG